MLTLQRRTVLANLARLGLATLAGAAAPLGAQSAKRGKLGARLRIVIPAVSRASLDQAGRALGDALVGLGLSDEIEYENLDGKGGALGLTHFAEKYHSDPNALLMVDTTLLGAAALQNSAADFARVQPVARLTNDYLVVVVAGKAPLKNITELAGRLRDNPKQTPIAIGPAGGVEHVFAGLLGKLASSRLEDAVYLPFVRSFELVDAVLSGRAVVGISAFSAFRDELANGKLRALGVSSKRTVYGLPSVREKGLEADLINWRAVFAGHGIAPARLAEMVEAVKAAVSYELWKKTLKLSHWEPSWMAGPDLSRSVDFDVKTAQLMVQLLKLKA